MNTEYSVVDDHGESQKVEHIRKVGPNMRRAVLSHTLGVKAVCLIWFEQRT
jgi:hypothetical protein